MWELYYNCFCVPFQVCIARAPAFIYSREHYSLSHELTLNKLSLFGSCVYRRAHAHPPRKSNSLSYSENRVTAHAQTNIYLVCACASSCPRACAVLPTRINSFNRLERLNHKKRTRITRRFEPSTSSLLTN